MTSAQTKRQKERERASAVLCWKQGITSKIVKVEGEEKSSFITLRF